MKAAYLLTVLLAALAAVATAQGDLPAARMCTRSAEEQQFCEDALSTWNDAQSNVKFSCVLPANGTKCEAAIADGDADLASFDSFEAYKAHAKYNLTALATEMEESALSPSSEYYAVVVVKKKLCDANPKLTFADLKGKALCSTGYRRTAGWTMTTGYMLVSDSMPYVKSNTSIENDAESVASFFGRVCAPRTSGNGPINTADGKGTLYPELCELCTKANATQRCTETDPFYGYDGALRCLNNEGEVVFTKHTTALDYAADSKAPPAWAKLKKDDMRLVCKRGGCAKVDDFAQCHVAEVPSHAVLVSPEYKARKQLYVALVNSHGNDEFADIVFSDSNPKNYMFHHELVAFGPVLNTKAYFGDTYPMFQAFAKL